MPSELGAFIFSWILWICFSRPFMYWPALVCVNSSLCISDSQVFHQNLSGWITPFGRGTTAEFVPVRPSRVLHSLALPPMNHCCCLTHLLIFLSWCRSVQVVTSIGTLRPEDSSRVIWLFTVRPRTETPSGHDVTFATSVANGLLSLLLMSISPFPWG